MIVCWFAYTHTTPKNKKINCYPFFSIFTIFISFCQNLWLLVAFYYFLSLISETLHRYFLPRFGLFCQAVSEEKIFRNRPIRNNNWLWQPCLLTKRDDMNNLYKGLSKEASYQVWFIWPSGFRGQYLFRNQPIRNKNCLWRPYLLTDRN